MGPALGCSILVIVLRILWLVYALHLDLIWWEYREMMESRVFLKLRITTILELKILFNFSGWGGRIFVWIQDHGPGSCDYSFVSFNNYLFGSRGFLLVVFTCSYYMVPFNFYSYLSFARNYECVVVPSLRSPARIYLWLVPRGLLILVYLQY